jgi:hypothetical protein
MQTQNDGQLGLIGFVDDAINRVFAPKEIKGKDGATVGTSVTMRSRKDIAEALNLKGKDNKEALDTKILEQSDSAFRQVKAQIAGLNADWTLAKVSQRTLGNGVRQISVVVKEIKRQVGPKDEDIAKALGWTVEQVREARVRQTKALEEKTVEVQSNEPSDVQQARG